MAPTLKNSTISSFSAISTSEIILLTPTTSQRSLSLYPISKAQLWSSLSLPFWTPLRFQNGWTIGDWSAFVQVLRTQFGPLDPTADAENSIDNSGSESDNLKMQENQHIVKYNVDFNRFSIQTGWESWDKGVLWHQYYSGLAERIKDIMGQQGKPAMKTLAHYFSINN